MDKKFDMLITEALEQEGFGLKENQREMFFQYYEMLIETNKVMNLTTITEMEDVIMKHFIDSLSIIRILPDIREKEYQIIDVGTGAGFPGIPLKIAFPQLKVTLLDSLNKRVNFLKETADTLKLSGIEAIHGRAEDYGRNLRYREQFDLCVSRAVANLSTLSEYCMPFVKKSGYFIPYKSGKLEEELVNGRGAIKKLGGIIENINSFSLPNSDERALVKINKVENTNKKYPRKAGMPSKDPLK